MINLEVNEKIGDYVILKKGEIIVFDDSMG